MLSIVWPSGSCGAWGSARLRLSVPRQEPPLPLKPRVAPRLKDILALNCVSPFFSLSEGDFEVFEPDVIVLPVSFLATELGEDPGRPLSFDHFSQPPNRLCAVGIRGFCVAPPSCLLGSSRPLHLGCIGCLTLESCSSIPARQGERRHKAAVIENAQRVPARPDNGPFYHKAVSS